MNTGFWIVIVLLMLLLFCFVLFYVLTQQSLRDISFRLDALQPTAKKTAAVTRSIEAIRRERAFCHDKLVVFEAKLSIAPREDLTPEEVQEIDKARQTIKRCIDELKASGDWMGLPFDFEWTEILDRLPNVNVLYRKAVAAADAAAGEAAAPKSA